MNIRQNFIIFSFICVCTALCFLSYVGHFNEFGNEHSTPPKSPVNDTVEESYFKNVTFYSIEKGKAFLELNSVELSLSNTDGVVVSFDPVGLVYRYDKETGNALEPVHFQSKNSRAFLKKKEIFLENDVEIKMSNTILRALKVSILKEGDLVYAYNNVKTFSTVLKTNDEIIVNSNNAVFHPKIEKIEYQGEVKGQVKRKRIYEESVSFNTDLLTYNGQLSLVEMQGNVALKKENLDAFSNRGEIFLENYNKKLKYYALYDDVRLQEKLLNGGKSLVRKAFGEKLEGIMSEKKIILTGLPKVFQGRDVIKGNRIIIRENVETVEVDDANTNIILEKSKE